MVKHPHASTRDIGSVPDWGSKIPQALKQLSPPAATTEAWELKTWVPQLRLEAAK